MIVLDLEWNRGYDKKPLDEILQIGAVRMDGLGGPITDTFNAYIRPRVHKCLNHLAKELPELASILASQLTFPQAMEDFRRWCGGERVFAVWGGDDVDILSQNCGYWGLPGVKADITYDFQAAFSQRAGTQQSMALSRAVEYCALPDTFDYHNALNDALYTALISAWIREEDLELQEIPVRLRRLAVSAAARPYDRELFQPKGPSGQPGNTAAGLSPLRFGELGAPVVLSGGIVLVWDLPVCRARVFSLPYDHFAAGEWLLAGPCGSAPGDPELFAGVLRRHSWGGLCVQTEPPPPEAAEKVELQR